MFLFKDRDCPRKGANRLIAGILVCLFGLQSSARPFSEISAPPPVSPLKVPQALGTLEAYFAPSPSGEFPSVIHLQDAHASPEAQRKIRDLLKWLSTKRPLWVALEGSVGELHPEYLNLFPQYPQVNDLVVRDLVEEGLISGAELFAWEEYQRSNGHQVYFVGVEPPVLYRENLKAYRQFFRGDKKNRTALGEFQNSLNSAEAKMLNHALHYFLREMERRKEGEFGSGIQSPNLSAYLGFLSKTAFSSLGIDLQDRIEQIRFPNLTRLLFLTSAESSSSRLKSRDGSTSFRRHSPGAWNPGRVLRLRSPGQGRGPSRLLNRRCRAILQSEMDAKRLFDEIRLLEAALRRALTQNQAEARLVEIHEDFRLLKKLFHLELTREEYKRVLERKEAMFPSRLGQRLSRLWKNTPARSNASDTDFKAALQFYSLAWERDRSLLENALQEAEKEKSRFKKSPLIVLITGGFHTDGLTRMLRERNAPHAVIAPRIAQADNGEARYHELMTGGWLSSHLKWALPLTARANYRLLNRPEEQERVFRRAQAKGRERLGLPTAPLHIGARRSSGISELASFVGRASRKNRWSEARQLQLSKAFQPDQSFSSSLSGRREGQRAQAIINSNTIPIPEASFTMRGIGASQTVTKEEVTSRPKAWKRALATTSRRYGSSITERYIPETKITFKHNNHNGIDYKKYSGLVTKPRSEARAEIRGAKRNRVRGTEMPVAMSPQFNERRGNSKPARLLGQSNGSSWAFHKNGPGRSETWTEVVKLAEEIERAIIAYLQNNGLHDLIKMAQFRFDDLPMTMAHALRERGWPLKIEDAGWRRLVGARYAAYMLDQMGENALVAGPIAAGFSQALLSWLEVELRQVEYEEIAKRLETEPRGRNRARAEVRSPQSVDVPSKAEPQIQRITKANPRPQAILFDFDGTLSDTLSLQEMVFGKLHHWIVGLTAEDAPAPMRWDSRAAAKLEVSLPAAPGLPGVSEAAGFLQPPEPEAKGVPARGSRPRAGGGDAERSRPLTSEEPSPPEIMPGKNFLHETMGRLSTDQILQMIKTSAAKHGDRAEEKLMLVLGRLRERYGVLEKIKSFFPDGKASLLQRLVTGFASIYEAVLIQGIKVDPPKPLPGVLEFLGYLHQSGVHLNIGTGTVRGVAEEIVNQWGIRNYFDGVYGAVVGENPFPNGKSDMVRKIKSDLESERLRESPALFFLKWFQDIFNFLNPFKIFRLDLFVRDNQLMIFGDGMGDMKASKHRELRITGVGITRGSRDLKPVLSKAGADFLIPSLENWRFYLEPLGFIRSEARQGLDGEAWLIENAAQFYGKTFIHVSPGFKPSPEWLAVFEDSEMRVLVANAHQTGGLEPLVTEELLRLTEMGMNALGVSLLYHRAPFQDEAGEISYQPVNYQDAIRAGRLIHLGFVDVPFKGREERAQVWAAPFMSQTGKAAVVLFLEHPEITDEIYSDRLRAEQMLLLGRGTLALIKEIQNKDSELHRQLLGLNFLPFDRLEVEIVQLNEALSAFAHPQAIDDTLTPALVQNLNGPKIYGFTTHTPVLSGLQKFPVHRADEIRINPLWLPWIIRNSLLDITALAMLIADGINAVSTEHALVTLTDLYPEFAGSIWGIVNGVYLPHWQLKEMAALVGKEFTDDHAAKMMTVHLEAKGRLADWIRKKYKPKPDPSRFWVAEARRKTFFKVVDTFVLAMADPRLRSEFLQSETVQFFFGKPHIRDGWGKARVKELMALSQGRVVRVNESTLQEELIAEDPRLVGRVFYFPNFNAAEAYLIFQGVDALGMWSRLRTEASSTGNQKALANAIPTIASKTGGPLEQIQDGKNGVFIEEYGPDGRPSPAGLVNAIKRMSGIFYARDSWMRMMWEALQTTPEVDIETALKKYFTLIWAPAYRAEQIVRELLAVSPPQDTELNPQEFMRLLSASFKQKYGEKDMLAVRLKHWIQRQSLETLKDFLRPLSELTPAEAQTEFGEAAIPRVIALVSILAPELMDNSIRSWNPSAFELLKPAREINDQWELSFHDTDDDSVFAFSRSFEGRRYVTPIIFSKPFRRVDGVPLSLPRLPPPEKIFRYNDGKIWLHIFGMDRLGIQPDERYPVYELTVRNLYQPRNGTELLQGWRVGIPVIPGHRDQNGIAQLGWGFQFLDLSDPKIRRLTDVELARDSTMRSEARGRRKAVQDGAAPADFGQKVMEVIHQIEATLSVSDPDHNKNLILEDLSQALQGRNLRETYTLIARAFENFPESSLSSLGSVRAALKKLKDRADSRLSAGQRESPTRLREAPPRKKSPGRRQGRSEERQVPRMLAVPEQWVSGARSEERENQKSAAPFEEQPRKIQGYGGGSLERFHSSLENLRNEAGNMRRLPFKALYGLDRGRWILKKRYKQLSPDLESIAMAPNKFNLTPPMARVELAQIGAGVGVSIDRRRKTQLLFGIAFWTIGGFLFPILGSSISFWILVSFGVSFPFVFGSAALMWRMRAERQAQVPDFLIQEASSILTGVLRFLETYDNTKDEKASLFKDRIMAYADDLWKIVEETDFPTGPFLEFHKLLTHATASLPHLERPHLESGHQSDLAAWRSKGKLAPSYARGLRNILNSLDNFPSLRPGLKKETLPRSGMRNHSAAHAEIQKVRLLGEVRTARSGPPERFRPRSEIRREIDVVGDQPAHRDLDSTWQFRKSFLEREEIGSRMGFGSRLETIKKDPLIRRGLRLAGFLPEIPVMAKRFRLTIPQAEAAVAGILMESEKTTGVLQSSGRIETWLSRLGLPSVEKVQKGSEKIAFVYLPSAAFKQGLLAALPGILDSYGKEASAGVVAPSVYQPLVSQIRNELGEGQELLEGEKLEEVLGKVRALKPGRVVILVGSGDPYLSRSEIRRMISDPHIQVEVRTVTSLDLDRAHQAVPGLAEKIASFAAQVALKTAA